MDDSVLLRYTRSRSPQRTQDGYAAKANVSYCGDCFFTDTA